MAQSLWGKLVEEGVNTLVPAGAGGTNTDSWSMSFCFPSGAGGFP